MKSRHWEADATPAKLRDTLWTKIFMSSGISTEFLNNPDVRELQRVIDNKYNLPCKFTVTITHVEPVQQLPVLGVFCLQP